jgi:signal transduction histidine kinase
MRGTLTLSDAVWRRRHRYIVALALANAVALPLIALANDRSLPTALITAAVVAALAGTALIGLGGALSANARRVHSLLAVVALLTASASIVHMTGGPIWAQLHLFVMAGVIGFYEDWLPFGVAVAFVLGLRLFFGGSSWEWTAIDSAFIAALAGALVVGWRATERQRGQLVASDRRQRAIFDALEEGVLLIGRDGTMESANPAAQRLLEGGLELREFALPFVVRDQEGNEVPSTERPAALAARTGRPLSGIELSIHRDDDTVLWVRVSAIPLPEDLRDEPPYPVVVSFADVTAARAGVQALERSNAELRQFAYVASHDLSEPLRMVTSYLQLLKRRYGDGRLGEDADEFIRHAVDGAVRMRALIEDLLSYSRAGRSSEPRAVDCADLVASVLTDLGAAVEEAAAVVEVGELPSVLGDRMQLRQVFQNLLANALKFRRGPGVRVWVGAEASGAGWTFTVADDGIGIPPGQRERVFEMFQRLHGRDDFEGTGIGLSICRKIVEHHGGSIAADERDGGGTDFRFDLPAAPAGSAAPPRAAAAGTR